MTAISRMMSKMRQTSLMDCPRCGQLCVGARVLPCGHLLCLNCLRLLLDTGADQAVDCPTCHSTVSPARTPAQPQVEQFPRDGVMDQLVMDVLKERSGGRCSVPHDSPSSPPSNVCLDCGDVLCESCSHVHRNSLASKHHTLKPLNSPTPPRPSPSRRHQDDDSGVSDNKKNILKSALKTEVLMYRQFKPTYDQVIDDMEHLLKLRKTNQKVLKAYNDHLLSANVNCDDATLQRFRHVRRECQSTAQADMKYLRQVQLRKSFPRKPGAQDVSKSKGPACEEHCRELSWTPLKVALCVALPVVVSLLLGRLLLPPVTSLPIWSWWEESPAVPYTADRVALLALDPASSSLTGSLCGHGWSGHYDDDVYDVLVTADRRLVLVRWYQKSLVVKSSSGDHTVSLGCKPFDVAQLHSGLVAVTCPGTPAVLLVNLDSGDHQIQHIPTEKEYYHVAAHPVDDTLIVDTWSDTVDVITLQGQVVRTLADRRHLSLGIITSLTVAREHLLVTGGGNQQIRRIPLSDSSQPLVETLPGIFPSYPVDTAVDKAGNVFVVLRDGGVVMRTTGGAARPLLPGQGGGETYDWCRIALQDDRVVVVTGKGRKSDVREYRLVDQ